MTEAALQGAARVTHRRVLKIALPIVLSNATVPILGAVDVGVVGQMGEAAPIGAVGLGAIILSSLYWAFGFLRMGTVGLVGQAEGAGDHAEVSAWLTRALLVAAKKDHGLAHAALVHGRPGNEIVDFAEENNIDCIIVFSHKPDISDYFLGSTAGRVVRRATCSVHVIR